jgi:hypothetical protein
MVPRVPVMYHGCFPEPLVNGPFWYPNFFSLRMSSPCEQGDKLGTLPPLLRECQLFDGFKRRRIDSDTVDIRQTVIADLGMHINPIVE